jgi:AcrR family transcriptional regulator
MSESMQGSVGQEGVGQAGDGSAATPTRKVYRRLSESLSDEQQRALGMITEGISIRDVGQQLGINRGTIYRWLKADPYFRAMYNAWQLEQQESCRAALVKAAEKAVKRVVEAMAVDQNLAWRVIKELGILSRPRPLLVKPSRVEMEIALEDHEEESVLLKRISHEVEDEEDLASPRGDLGRLLRLKGDAELGGSRRFEQEAAASPPEAVSRE